MTSTKETEQRSALGRVLDWWSETSGRWARMSELRALSRDELDRMASDLGFTSAELLEASGRPDAVEALLGQRLAALGLDPEEIWKLSPVLLRELQRTCCKCADRDRCSDDMRTSPLMPGWETYCPNSGTLRTLT